MECKTFLDFDLDFELLEKCTQNGQKQIFLEFADEEREHLELLIREYRALVSRQSPANSSRQSVRRSRSATA